VREGIPPGELGLDAEMRLGTARHLLRRPRRVPDQVDFDLEGARKTSTALIRTGHNVVLSRATRRRHGDGGSDDAVLDLQLVDQSKIDDVVQQGPTVWQVVIGRRATAAA
jgi:hypothetical protein